MSRATSYSLDTLKKRYITLKAIELFFWTVAFGVLAGGVLMLFLMPLFVKGLIILLTLTAAFIAGFYLLKLNQPHDRKIIRFLDQCFPQLENSADLLLKEPRTLTSLEKLQQEKIKKTFEVVSPALKIPQRIPAAFSALVICLLISFLLSFVSNNKRHSSSDMAGLPSRTVVVPVSVDELTIEVAPPAYTAIASYKTNNPHLNLPAGSKVGWNVTFRESSQHVFLWISGLDSIALIKSENRYTAVRAFETSHFYQISWTATDGREYSSDFFKIEVTEDRPPEIKIENQKQFIELTPHDKLSVPISVILRDDYGLTNSYIVATVSKGSGESVKFREETLAFSNPGKITGKKIQATREIDLRQLALDPGDELYFYVVAVDNKVPKANTSRSETYFIALTDTSQTELSFEGGLGVDLMPEYFRSQRQIIIDTEKLLREKTKIAKADFNSRSNELGYDQKVLRLKYGQFLGEEFETGIGPGSHSVTSSDDDHDHDHDHDHEENDVTKQFGHVHDREGDHHHDHAPKKHDHHNHQERKNADEAQEDPLKEFIHSHDDPEEATFFTQSIRTKLKATLTIMWDAELYLRLFEPEKSLPYQYKALKLLKEISNDSRIYVHRTGFDAPPIKEEKRLSGDLSDVKSTIDRNSKTERPKFLHIRNAIATTEKLSHMESNRPLSESEKRIFQEAGRELSTIAMQHPGRYLETLSLLQNLITAEELPADFRIRLMKIRRSLYHAIPDHSSTPSQTEHPVTHLDQVFLRNINKP